MSPQEELETKVLKIYTQIFRYKDLLKGAPDLTIDPKFVTIETQSKQLPVIMEQTKMAVAYLLAIKLENLTIASMIKAVEKYYKKDDFWKRLLISYIDAYHTFDGDILKQKKDDLKDQVATLQKKVSSYRAARQQLIETFANAVEKEKFPVDAKKLFANYLNMSEANPKEAWQMLIVHPAYFSKIITTDKTGRLVLTPKEAKEQDDRLGAFIKNLKA